MTDDLLSVLCDPLTHDHLERPASPAGPKDDECLVNPATGQRFPVRAGIPVFLGETDVSGSNGKYQRLYDRFAPFYDFSTWLYARWKGMDVETRLREYLDELEVKPNDRVLEVSVGTGRNLPFLTPGAGLYGLDLSWGMLRRCAQNAARRRLDVALVMGSAERLPFRAETFDVVFHFGGINFFNDRAAALREMVRVAKPGTKFIVGDENEALARKYEGVPVTGEFYGNRQAPITAPVDLLPPGMQEVQVKDIAGGDLYCLSFRKPR
jgi:ubiquinone/menaquinone biosynthesis C-methylase UbiE